MTTKKNTPKPKKKIIRPTREHAAALTEKDLRKVERDPEYKHIWVPKT